MQRPERTVRPPDRLIEDDSTSTEESKIEAEVQEENDDDEIMAATISKLDSALIHVLTISVAGHTAQDHIPLACNQQDMHTVDDLIEVDDADILIIFASYNDQEDLKGTTAYLSKGKLCKLLRVIQYCRHRMAQSATDSNATDLSK